MNVDLHCHSTASDGLLAPASLVQRAARNGVDVLALTDHDTVDGLREARDAAAACGVRLVTGVEVSVTWNDSTVHIVGLKVDPEHEALVQGLGAVRGSRISRARKIAAELQAIGIPGCYEGAMRHVDNPEIISRTHFARFLVECGRAPDVRGVFDRYLAQGKPGYVSHRWAELSEAVGWIRASGGVAVVAHPGRYRMSRRQMRSFLGEFRDAGGAGVEVVTGSHTEEQYGDYAILSREFGLCASRGSDFHGPGESRTEPGAIANLPEDLKPIWHDW